MQLMGNFNGVIYRIEIEDSISEESLGAFGKSQTYRYDGFVIIIFVALELVKNYYKRTVTGAEGTTEGGKQNINKSKSWKIGEIKYRQSITCWNCNQKRHFHNQCLKLVASRDKEVNMARDSDDALVCCVENTVEDRIMDSGALFHATYCKEELERFKLCSSKVHLADDKTLDIIGVGDVLDKEGYHVGFGYQQWKVTKGSFVVAHGNKRGSLWFGEAEEAFLHDVKEDKEIVETAAGVVVGLRIPEEEWRGKDTSLAHLKVFGCDLFVKVKDVYGEDMNCTFIGSGLDEMRYSFQDTKSHQVIQSRDITFMDSIYGASIVAEHGLSSEITQSPGGSSDTSEGSKNSRSFEDSGRSDEEYSEDGASSKEGGFETPQVRRSNTESRALVRYSPSANYLLLTENVEPKSYS
ncbi:hypothetical protein Tco_1071790 [Tanacetum coccineum]